MVVSFVSLDPYQSLSNTTQSSYQTFRFRMTRFQLDQERNQCPAYERYLHHSDDAQHAQMEQRHQRQQPPPQQQQQQQPASPHVSSFSSNPQHIYDQNNQSRTAQRQSTLPRPWETYIHPERCPPLNLEFLWKIYSRRAEVPNEEPDSSRRRTHQERIGILQSQGFPTGLASLMLQHAVDLPLRIFLIDNSGTMHRNDARLVSQSSSGVVQTVGCTRWEAVTPTIIWHAEMAAWRQTPMAVRLLHDPGMNVGPQQLGISASKHYSSREEVERLKDLLRASRPNGATCPLNVHMKELLPSISAVAPKLVRQGRRVFLCICTDRIPTDSVGTENPQVIQDFLSTLGKLLEWPVQVVFRLSTKDERVTQFYMNLIAKSRPEQPDHVFPNLGFDETSTDTGDVSNVCEHLQVLDDYVSECERVQERNPWLNYGYPLHLCREEGICFKSIEALSQRRLRRNEALQVVGCLFDQNISDNISSNETQLHAVRRRIEDLNSQSGVLWNPVKKKFVHWIDLKILHKLYFNRGNTGKGISSGDNHHNHNNSSTCAIM